MAVGRAEDANVILLNTCAIRDKAEQRIWHRLKELRGIFKSSNRKRMKSTSDKSTSKLGDEEGDGHNTTQAPPVVGVLGCMAERLKGALLEEDRLVDIVAGPDAYRDLPRLLKIVLEGEASSEETEQSEQWRDETSSEVSEEKSSARDMSNSSSRDRSRRIYSQENVRHSSGGVMNVQLSLEETYADIAPVRLSRSQVNSKGSDGRRWS